jgi:Asp-tRNA(Asn)/Glu-tRNA(Gln) amidotransferase A subunit family amidase
VADPVTFFRSAICGRGLLLAAGSALLAAALAAQEPRPPFRIEEATIAQIHQAMRDGRLTCRSLVEQYLRRIDAYDKNGPALNAIVVVNPQAREQAGELDRAFPGGSSLDRRPLHCVPLIVKDNFDTVGLQTAAGSLALEGFVPHADAFQVRRVKEAGAIVLAKSNMAEFAFSPYETVNSILPGYTRNPYALDRVTAGSSGGTAAAVAANFGAAGLGTDTGNSIRGPSAHQSLVGIRSTMGLTSRAGVVPLNLLADIAGPMTRTVEDAVAILQVIAGEDPDDLATAASRGREIPRYADSLVRDGLRGARIGVLRQAYERETTDPEVVEVFERALEDMKRAGAAIVDPATIDGLEGLRRTPGLSCGGFKYDLERYLAAHEHAPHRTLEAIVKSNRFHPSIRTRLESASKASAEGPGSEGCRAESAYRESVRAMVVRTMDALTLDGFAYPTWSNPPRLIGDLNTPHGDNSQFFSPTTGFPSINVPMGYLRGGVLPAGVTFFGRPWSEPTLIRLAYAYEQATRHRRPPTTTPPLR